MAPDPPGPPVSPGEPVVVIFRVDANPVAQPRQRYRVVCPRGRKPYAMNYTPRDHDVQDWKSQWILFGRSGGMLCCSSGSLPRSSTTVLARKPSISGGWSSLRRRKFWNPSEDGTGGKENRGRFHVRDLVQQAYQELKAEVCRRHEHEHDEVYCPVCRESITIEGEGHDRT